MSKVSEEIEALKAVYGKDIEDRPPVWNIPSFAATIYAEKNLVFLGTAVPIYVVGTLMFHCFFSF
jgi:hypothetical protein